MKIGILTYHRTLNYGAFLQAYSLKKYIESLNHEVCIIDYWPSWHERMYKSLRLFQHVSLIIKLKIFVKDIIVLPWTIKRINVFEKRIIKDLKLSKKIKIKNGFDLKNLDFDFIIYGSDQIWRYNDTIEYKGFDSVYFGEYLPEKIKKVAYAASMGPVGDFGKTEWLKDHYKKFHELSVREYELSSFISVLLNKNIPIVMDPVFLNTKAFWESYFSSFKKIKMHEKYILFYNLLPNDSYTQLVKQFAKINCLKIIEITGSIIPSKIFQKNTYQCSDVRCFLQLLFNAEYVFSSSFHGIAFSIIFNKQFFALHTGKQLGRVKSLLEIVGLEDRIISSISDCINASEIDYSQIVDKLESKITYSRDFLKNILC